MKILVTSDLHNDFLFLDKLIETIKKEKPDYVFILGDVADFGIIRKNFFKKLINYFSSEKIFFVPGNNETFDILDVLEKKYKIKIFHKNYFKYYNFIFVGIGGGDTPIFRISDEEIEYFILNILNKFKNKKIILFSHLPPKGSKSSLNVSGSEKIYEFIKKSYIILNVHGHIHETGGLDEVLNKAIVLNAARSIFLIEIDKSSFKFKKII